MADKKHVAVLMGGWSSERPVSLNSGRECADNLEAAGYRVTRIDVARDIAEVLAKLKPDVVFNALHGTPGEDGTERLQAVGRSAGLRWVRHRRAILGLRTS